MDAQPNAVPSAVPSADDARARYLRRLAVAADEGRAYPIRVAAVRAALPDGHSLKVAPYGELAARLTRPWDVRTYLMNGRGVERTVTRPPACLGDVLKG
jgi:phage I-like protein